MEEWKIVFIESSPTQYEISNYGRLRNTTRKHWKTLGILVPKHNKSNGYYQYGMTHKQKEYYRYAHRLVAEHFIDNTLTYLTVNHKDGNKANNHVDNLEWLSQADNNRHGFRNGLIVTSKVVYQYDLHGNFIREFQSAAQAEQVTGVTQKNISNACCGNTKHAKMYQWSFVKLDKIPDITKQIKHHSDGVVQLTLDGQYVAEFDTLASAYEFLKIRDNGVISKVCKGKQKTSHGFKWAYKSDYYK